MPTAIFSGPQATAGRMATALSLSSYPALEGLGQNKFYTVSSTILETEQTPRPAWLWTMPGTCTAPQSLEATTLVMESFLSLSTAGAVGRRASFIRSPMVRMEGGPSPV